MDSENNEYTDERLEEFLKKEPATDPESIVHAVFEDVKKFSGDTPQSDDITMLSLRYNKS